MSVSLGANILMIEPFYGGSHKQLIDILVDRLGANNVDLFTLPAKKWHWRARTSALYFSQVIPLSHSFKYLFASSVLNLSELVALRPDLLVTVKIVYFHENQLIYPVKKSKDRDFQYGYNQIITCLVANIIIFNSQFNKDSFLSHIKKFLKLQPDFRPKHIKEEIEPKCRVLYFPIKLPMVPACAKDNSILHIVWPHRWEHDKDPDTFFSVLSTLSGTSNEFRLSVLGETFTEIPPIFSESKITLHKHILHFGFVESKEQYYSILKQAHIVVSTAKHEFYGVSMLEAVYCGCFPLCPNALVYPEIYPQQCLYKDESQLVTRLAKFCKNPLSASLARSELDIDFSMYSSEHLLPQYQQLFQSV